jgi:hypothetical protein
MERLHELVMELRQSLPFCYICHKSAYETGVYLMFGCFHFLCKDCARTADCLEHTECRSTPVELDYTALNQERDAMVSAAEAFFQGNTPSFPQVFAAYFRFIGKVAPFLPSDRPAPMPEEGWKCSCGVTNPKTQDYCSGCRPVRNAPEQPQTWTCKCGRQLPIDKRYCSKCKFFNIKTTSCAVCQADPCCCAVFVGLVSSDVWQCNKCRYGFNPSETGKCVKCDAMMPGLE